MEIFETCAVCFAEQVNVTELGSMYRHKMKYKTNKKVYKQKQMKSGKWDMLFLYEEGVHVHHLQ